LRRLVAVVLSRLVKQSHPKGASLHPFKNNGIRRERRFCRVRFRPQKLAFNKRNKPRTLKQQHEPRPTWRLLSVNSGDCL
jgi:hypothetical protein